MPDFAGSGQIPPTPEQLSVGVMGASTGEDLSGSAPVKTTGILWPPR